MNTRTRTGCNHPSFLVSKLPATAIRWSATIRRRSIPCTRCIMPWSRFWRLASVSSSHRSVKLLCHRKNETDCQLNDRALLGILGRCGIVAINRILEEALQTTELPTPACSTIRPRSCQKGQHHSDSDGGRFRSSWRRSCRAPHLDGLCEGTVDNKIGARNAARNRARKKNDARGNFLRSAHAARRI